MDFTACRSLPFFVRKYECREHIGGNMSEVYLAYDARAERSVVVKLMRPEQRSDPELRERFLQEGRLACRCAHANVITTYVTDEDECGPYIVMERLPGALAAGRDGLRRSIRSHCRDQDWRAASGGAALSARDRNSASRHKAA
jgi:serine/threonine protein kinase